MKTSDIEKLNAIFAEVYEKDIFIGIAKTDKDDTIVVAVGTQGKQIVRSFEYNLTNSSVSDIIMGIVKLKEDVLNAKREYGKGKGTGT